MKKKIIDLTIEDLEKTCEKYPYCDNCPFARVDIDYLTCLKQELEDNDCKSVKELINKEVEVLDNALEDEDEDDDEFYSTGW